jgi:hypothetical protein
MPNTSISMSQNTYNGTYRLIKQLSQVGMVILQE